MINKYITLPLSSYTLFKSYINSILYYNISYIIAKSEFRFTKTVKYAFDDISIIFIEQYCSPLLCVYIV